MRQFLHAAARADKDTKKQIRAAFRGVGNIVKVEAAHLFADRDQKSASGYRTVVRQRGVSVEQSLRRVTGKRGDYGALQMREALLPAVDNKDRDIEQEFDDAMERLADYFK